VKIETLLREIQPSAVVGPQDRNVLGVVCDSRQISEGCVFVAVPGNKQDGWSFVDDAIERGAVAIVSEHDGSAKRDICQIRVCDVRKALAELSCAFYDKPSGKLKIAGITGTNGKTTTAYMIRNAMRAAGWKPGLLGTIEYEIGERVIPAARTTPEAPALQSMLAQMVNSGCKSAVMEVSSHALDQKRTFGIDYDTAVFTNLTRDHLDYHETFEKYFDAKSLLFKGLGKGNKRAAAVINSDDPWGQRLIKMADMKADVLTYGIESDALVKASSLSLNSHGSSFTVHTPWGNEPIHIKFLGRFNVHNALAAIAACGAMGIPLKTIIESLSEMTLVLGRLEEVRNGKNGKGFRVFVDYAHTDDALENVLKTLRELNPKRLIVVFGCGGNRDRTKRPLMGQIAARLADYSIITSDNPRKEDPAQIITEIRQGFGASGNFETIEDRAEAIKRSIEIATKGDIILIAGKGHENFQEFANTIVPFDDRQVVKRFW
jgi:UDP-N-acetylmuramoyl-L-alanyl-D-glutamate--2,6-diaminopimelate ligase